MGEDRTMLVVHIDPSIRQYIDIIWKFLNSILGR